MDGVLLGYTVGYDQNPLRAKATVNKLVQPAWTNAMLPYYTGGLGAISYFPALLFNGLRPIPPPCLRCGSEAS